MSGVAKSWRDWGSTKGFLLIRTWKWKHSMISEAVPLKPSPEKPHYLRLIHISVSSFPATRSLPCSSISENCPNPSSRSQGLPERIASHGFSESRSSYQDAHTVCRDLKAFVLKWPTDPCQVGKLPMGKTTQLYFWPTTHPREAMRCEGT